MNNDMALTPADVRELAAEIIRSLDLIARNYDSYEYGLPVMTHYDEMVDTVVALLRTARGEGERVQEPTQEQIDDACMWYRHDFGLLSEKERDSVRFEARQWFRAWGKALSNETTTHAPADVREQVAKEVYVCEHVRRGAEESWARQRWQTETDGMRDLYFETADRILSLLRTPRGEGEGDTLWRDFEAALVEFEAAAIALGRREALPLGPREAAIDRVVQARRRVIDCACALAALRSDAQEGEADALDLIRWAESHHAALEPVVGNIMPPGTYACYVGDDDDPYMGPGILGAIRAAHLTDRSESDGA